MLKVEARLQFDSARAECPLRLTKVGGGDVIDNAAAIRLPASLQVYLIPEVKSVCSELNLRILTQDPIVGQTKSLCERSVGIEVVWTIEGIASNSCLVRQCTLRWK